MKIRRQVRAVLLADGELIYAPNLWLERTADDPPNFWWVTDEAGNQAAALEDEP